MSIVGIIAEYNPFHNGHYYQLNKAKSETKADFAIVIMSGDFVQRGEPAVFPKHLRTKMALSSGADLVIELPVRYATASAEKFALGAVSILNSLGIVDYLHFGSESGEIETLYKTAEILTNETPEFKEALQSLIKKGYSFPKARQQALSKCCGFESDFSTLKEANNILATEYLKAIIRTESKIKPHTVKRVGCGYNDATTRGNYLSALGIRALIKEYYESKTNDKTDTTAKVKSDLRFGIESLLSNKLPKSALTLAIDAYRARGPVFTDDFSLLLRYRLNNETPLSLLEYEDLYDSLANKIIANKNDFVTFTDLCNRIKTRDITYTHISRALLHIILELKKKADIPLYARVLGFKSDSHMIFNMIKNASKIPLVTNLSGLGAFPKNVQEQVLEDIRISDLYESVIADKFKLAPQRERSRELIKL
ncbi:MAG: nucleotidyltransferase family protein [Lachnospiraceae bacterium]|jgi:predicted nucleotidyltransferase|nr:nucleotidyltransferase family protein [Lachnospiraceae bacterium]